MINIKQPSAAQVQFYLNKWMKLENYVYQENSLKKLFIETYPLNIDMDDVLIKVCALNDFYSTNIFYPFKVAKHIVDLKIDQRLSNNDLNLVNEIALVKMKEDKAINFYSFATKYCSHHQPECYPIYDYYVDKMLNFFKKIDEFTLFNSSDLKKYPIFYEVLTKFRTYYCLENFTLKQIDQYLWLTGKEYFPKQKNKK